MKSVYVVILHDDSWGYTGDHVQMAFTDPELAKKQAEWLAEHLDLLEGDYVKVAELRVLDSIDKSGEGLSICSYDMGYHFSEEEEF